MRRDWYTKSSAVRVGVRIWCHRLVKLDSVSTTTIRSIDTNRLLLHPTTSIRGVRGVGDSSNPGRNLNLHKKIIIDIYKS